MMNSMALLEEQHGTENGAIDAEPPGAGFGVQEDIMILSESQVRNGSR
jgi:hypothetical protein